MAVISFAVTTVGEGVTGRHQTSATEFWTGESGSLDVPAQPNPLELLLGSLTGCMNVILQMVAAEKGWTEVSATYSAKGSLDPRGMMGDPDVAPYFARVQLCVHLNGVSRDDLDFVRHEIGRRCPVHRLFERAGIPIDESWDIG